MAGFGVYKFALKRIAEQAPPPWSLVEESCDGASGSTAVRDELDAPGHGTDPAEPNSSAAITKENQSSADAEQEKKTVATDKSVVENKVSDSVPDDGCTDKTSDPIQKSPVLDENSNVLNEEPI